MKPLPFLRQMSTTRLLISFALGLSLVMVIMWLLTTGPVGTIHAADINNVNTTDDELNSDGDCSLREAIESANTDTSVDACTAGSGDDTITLPAGIYVLTITGIGEDANATGDLDITDSNALTIVGAGSGQTIINAAGIDRVLDIRSGTGEVLISGITIMGGSRIGNWGGGINVETDASLILTNTVVYGNSATYGGGVSNRGQVTLRGGEIISNSGFNGGGVYINQSTAAFTQTGDSIIAYNSADYGGGVYINSGRVTLSGGQISTNTVSEDGGGVLVAGLNTNLHNIDGRIINNTADDEGGGVYVMVGHAMLEGGQTISNSASYGGGVFVDRGSATLSGGQIDYNSANGGGGVFISDSSGVFTQTEGTVSHNSAINVGGGVFVGDGSAALSGGQISHNSVLWWDGGGVYIGGAGRVTLSEGEIISNSADSGGGVYAFGHGATFSQTGGTIAHNTANKDGGGLYLYFGSATMSEGQIAHNSAIDGGGVFVRRSEAIFVQTGGTVASHTASNYGGGVYVDEGQATLSGGRILSNTATNGGGLYLGNSGTLSATNSCIVNNSDTGVHRVAGTLAATNNWWGAANGPSGAGTGGGDSVGAGIDYSAFLTSAPAGCPTLRSDLVIHKAVTPAAAAPGQAITFTLTFTNGGPHAARHVVISDSVPISVAVDSVSSSGVNVSQSGVGNDYAWSVTDMGLPVGAVGLITITGTLSEPLAAGTFTNTAAITSTTMDDSPANNSSTARVTASACFATRDDGATLYFTVQQAVDEADPGSTIKVAGTCAGVTNAGGHDQVVYIGKTLNLRGGYTPSDWSTSIPAVHTTTLDAEGGGRVVYLDGGGAVTLDNLRLVNGNISGNGSGIYDDDVTLILSNSVVYSNSGATLGGGVYVHQGQATLNGGQIVSNSATAGGGLYVYQGQAILDGGQIISNSANNGGGVFIYQSTAALTQTGNSAISHNSANTYGGAVYVRLGQVTLEEGQIVGNSATNGGGIYVYEGSATLEGGQISGNSATNGGAAFVNLSASTFDMTGDCAIANNSASNYGGGVYVNHGQATLSGGRILSNTANNSGGLYLGNTGTVNAANCCIVNNTDTSVSRIIGTLAATNNWWGAANGPSGAGTGGGDSVGAGINYSGFLTSAPAGCPTLRSDLVIHKAVTPAAAAPGQAITYTLTFTNGGPHVARHVVISDSLPISVAIDTVSSSGVNVSQSGVGNDYAWSVTDMGLPVGAVGLITIIGTLSEPLAAGTFTNTATITSTTLDDSPANNSDVAGMLVENVAPVYDDTTRNIAEDAAIGSSVGAPITGSDANGDVLSYSITGGNPGDAFAIDGSSGQITVAAPLDHESTPQYVLTLKASDGALTNTALVTVTVTNINDSDLVMSKDVDNTTPAEGNTIVYTLQVTNSGSDDATGVVVSDTLPAGVTYIDDDSDGTYHVASGAWSAGSLSAYASTTLHITVTVDVGTVDTSITNTVVISASDQTDPAPGNDVADAVITVIVFEIYLPLVLRNH